MTPSGLSLFVAAALCKRITAQHGLRAASSADVNEWPNCRAGRSARTRFAPEASKSHRKTPRNADIARFALSERHPSMRANRHAQNRASFLHRFGAHFDASSNRPIRTRQRASKRRRSHARKRIPACTNPIRKLMRPNARCGTVSTSRACRISMRRAQRFGVGLRAIFRRRIRAHLRMKKRARSGCFFEASNEASFGGLKRHEGTSFLRFPFPSLSAKMRYIICRIMYIMENIA
jgi:hypothetical protein